LRFKEPQTTIKCIKGLYYKYEVHYRYDPKKKRSVTKSTRLLGKITEEEGFIPSSKNKLREESKELPNVDIKTYGLYAMFETLLSEEITSLQSIFGKDTANKLLVFAMMRWADKTPGLLPFPRFLLRILGKHQPSFRQSYHQSSEKYRRKSRTRSSMDANAFTQKRPLRKLRSHGLHAHHERLGRTGYQRSGLQSFL
jgi:hypothetical protein